MLVPGRGVRDERPTVNCIATNQSKKENRYRIRSYVIRVRIMFRVGSCPCVIDAISGLYAVYCDVPDKNGIQRKA